MIADKDLKALASRAKKVLKKLKNNFDPVVIEFAGSPKSGKTTTIDIIKHFFKRMSFKVWAPTEGASQRTPYHLRRDLVAFNTWALNYAVSELLVSYYNIDRQHLIILDRGPFDSLAWMSLLKKMNKLTDEEYEIIEKFALHPKWLSLISRVYLFTCKPSVSLDREHQSKLIRAPGTAMNPKMLEGILTEYKSLKKKMKVVPLYDVTTSKNTTPRETSYEITSDILKIFETKIHGK